MYDILKTIPPSKFEGKKKRPDIAIIFYDNLKKIQCVLIIENKINSSEHSNQTEIYAKAMNNLPIPCWLGIFLTKQGEPADSKNFIPVQRKRALRPVVSDYLKKMIVKSGANGEIINLIRQYHEKLTVECELDDLYEKINQEFVSVIDRKNQEEIKSLAPDVLPIFIDLLKRNTINKITPIPWTEICNEKKHPIPEKYESNRVYAIKFYKSKYFKQLKQIEKELNLKISDFIPSGPNFWIKKKERTIAKVMLRKKYIELGIGKNANHANYYNLHYADKHDYDKISFNNQDLIKIKEALKRS